MGNLYSDNIEDKDMYRDQDVLKDVRALIAMGHREGTLIDYKKDISDKDNWPEAAAFANTFGGLIIFGVEDRQGKPVLLTGFDPQAVETKTKLVSILLSRLQPRPEFQLRIVNLDTDKTKEVAVLRISEGTAPPYLHSNRHEHRIYIRMGAQKAEADYLQLNGLFQKRKQGVSEAVASLEDLVGSKSPLRVHDPPGSNLISRHFYRFILAPEDSRAARRLTGDVEREFGRAVGLTYGGDQNLNPELRTRATTCFRRSLTNPIEQRFTISSSGSIGFISHACLKTDKGFFFAPAHFCRDLINFLTLGSLFYDRTRYYGSCLLDVNLTSLDGTNIYKKQAPFENDDFFEPPLEEIQAGQVGAQTRILQQPPTVELMNNQLEDVLNDIGRELGRIVSPNFKFMTNKYVTERIKRLSNI